MPPFVVGVVATAASGTSSLLRFFFQAEDGIRDWSVTGVQTCALPIFALAQIAPKLGDPDSNLKRHLDLVRRARSKGADLVVFPELSLTGYMLQDLVPEVEIGRASCRDRV